MWISGSCKGLSLHLGFMAVGLWWATCGSLFVYSCFDLILSFYCITISDKSLATVTQHFLLPSLGWNLLMLVLLLLSHGSLKRSVHAFSLFLFFFHYWVIFIDLSSGWLIFFHLHFAIKTVQCISLQVFYFFVLGVPFGSFLLFLSLFWDFLSFHHIFF